VIISIPPAMLQKWTWISEICVVNEGCDIILLNCSESQVPCDPDFPQNLLHKAYRF
jgi:hypothetical protein